MNSSIFIFPGKASVFFKEQAAAKFGRCHLYTREVVIGQIQRLQLEYFEDSILIYIYGGGR